MRLEQLSQVGSRDGAAAVEAEGLRRELAVAEVKLQRMHEIESSKNALDLALVEAKLCLEEVEVKLDGQDEAREHLASAVLSERKLRDEAEAELTKLKSLLKAQGEPDTDGEAVQLRSELKRSQAQLQDALNATKKAEEGQTLRPCTECEEMRAELEEIEGAAAEGAAAEAEARGLRRELKKVQGQLQQHVQMVGGQSAADQMAKSTCSALVQKDTELSDVRSQLTQLQEQTEEGGKATKRRWEQHNKTCEQLQIAQQTARDARASAFWSLVVFRLQTVHCESELQLLKGKWLVISNQLSPWASETEADPSTLLPALLEALTQTQQMLGDAETGHEETEAALAKTEAALAIAESETKSMQQNWEEMKEAAQQAIEAHEQIEMQLQHQNALIDSDKNASEEAAVPKPAVSALAKLRPCTVCEELRAELDEVEAAAAEGAAAEAEARGLRRELKKVQEEVIFVRQALAREQEHAADALATTTEALAREQLYAKTSETKKGHRKATLQVYEVKCTPNPLQSRKSALGDSSNVAVRPPRRPPLPPPSPHVVVSTTRSA